MKPSTKISNMFICHRGNKLKLVDLDFDTSIKSIQYKLRRSVDWEEIDTEEKLRNFISGLPESTLGNNNLLDGNYKILIPGGIDTHVHFNTPGYEFREDFEHASTAAAVGGTTMVFDMPDTCKPPVVSQVNFTSKENFLNKKSLIDYSLWGGIRRNDFKLERPPFADILELSRCGIVGYKVYLTSGMDSFRDLTFDQLLSTAKKVTQFNGLIAVHAEDKFLINSTTERLQKEGQNDWKAYCKARSVKAEMRAVQNVIKIAEETGCRFHIVHLSSGEALNLICDAKERGIKISTETCPHYLHFTQEDFDNKSISNYLKTAPPVKFNSDRKALWNGLASEKIDLFTTDHAGCNPDEEKNASDFWKVYGGIPGVQHRVPYLFSEGFIEGRLTLEQTINLLSSNAAEMFNITYKGKIEKTFDADFVLIDPWKSSIIKSDEMLSKGKYTPFNGLKLNCKIESVYLRGTQLYNNEENFISDDFTYGNLIKL
jgi:allantoinase